MIEKGIWRIEGEIYEKISASSTRLNKK